jgi:molybdenum cofactor synthesis domain-containing protein
MTESRIYTAALVIIGDEILSGRTQDKNISQIALWLNIQGIRLREVRVVGDDQDAIVEAVNALRTRNDYLFTTGGIGPTHDDITVDAIAVALGVDVVIHPEASAVLHKYYETRGGINPGRLRMARVPYGADLIPNKMSGAPGIRHGNIFIMAGVPHITAGMLDAGNWKAARLCSRIRSGAGSLKAKSPSYLQIPKNIMKAARSVATPFSARAR